MLRNSSLVKTVKFNKFEYIGDPANTVRIFNELEVDELCFLDITATIENREPNYKVLKEIAEESFMPLSYGGGIKSFDQAKKILGMGFEKVVINSANITQPGLIAEISNHFGSQSVVGSIDVKTTLFGGKKIFINSGNKKIEGNILDWVKQMENEGVGEILITSIDQEGTWSGYDLDLIKEVNDNVGVPVIANGGCGMVGDLKKVFGISGVQAAAVGVWFYFRSKVWGSCELSSKEIEKIKE